jgi:ankyrin repeat protein
VEFESLFELCAKNCFEQLKSELNNIEDINYRQPETGWSLLSVSTFNHSLQCIEILLDSGADINIVNNKGTSILMYAKTKVFQNRNFFLLDYLIKRGANPFVKDFFGKTIFDYVNEKDDFEMKEYFNKILNKKKFNNCKKIRF